MSDKSQRGEASGPRLLEVDAHAAELFRALCRHSENGVSVADRDARYVLVNQAMCEMTGYTERELLGMRVFDIVAPGVDVRLLPRILSERRGGYRTAELRRKDGTVFTAGVTGFPVSLDGVPHALAVVRDISHEHRLEEQLRHAQKMEAVGQLAGGVAHDFNNILTAILGHTQLALEALRTGPLTAPVEQISRSLDQIEQASRQASAVTRQLLTFSRNRLKHQEVLDLSRVVGGMLPLLSQLLGEEVRLELSAGDARLPVLGDAGLIQQVVLNLAVNARDAMQGRGRLVIETRRERMADGVERAMLVVEDDGCGMSAEVRRRAFDPFFTTKPPGMGTGLGLSTVYGIVREFGGTIHIDDGTERGSRLVIALPLTDQDPGEDLRPAEMPLLRGRETVLVCEDDSMVRELMRESLLRLGYRVLTASSGENALEVAAAEGGEIDILVTDVVMPGMSGPELALALRERRPGLAILFASGYTFDVLARAGLPEDELDLLPKPFGPLQLSRRVREVLDRRRATDPGPQQVPE